MNEMYKYLKEHNYISKNENKDPLRQQELSTARAECIVNKYINLTEQLQQENKQLKNNINQMNDSVDKLQKELNEENLQCSKYAIEINDLKEKNKQLKDNWNKLKEDLKLVIDYGSGDEASRWDKIYGEHAKSTLETMQELEGSDSSD